MKSSHLAVIHLHHFSWTFPILLNLPNEQKLTEYIDLIKFSIKLPWNNPSHLPNLRQNSLKFFFPTSSRLLRQTPTYLTGVSPSCHLTWFLRKLVKVFSSIKGRTTASKVIIALLRKENLVSWAPKISKKRKRLHFRKNALNYERIFFNYRNR